jgi:hypothetical protein
MVRVCEQDLPVCQMIRLDFFFFFFLCSIVFLAAEKRHVDVLYIGF